jgi:hypothetical protein
MLDAGCWMLDAGINWSCKIKEFHSCNSKNSCNEKIKRGQPLTLPSKLTHESTLLFYNSFRLFGTGTYEL